MEVSSSSDDWGLSVPGSEGCKTWPSVRELAVALLQVAQSVDVKYLKPPLGEATIIISPLMPVV